MGMKDSQGSWKHFSLKIWWFSLSTGYSNLPTASNTILCHWKYSNKAIYTTASIMCGWAGGVTQMLWPLGVNLHWMTDGWTEGWTGRWMDGRTDRLMDRQTNRPTDSRTTGQMDQWTDAPMDRQTDGQTDSHMRGEQISAVLRKCLLTKIWTNFFKIPEKY